MAKSRTKKPARKKMAVTSGKVVVRMKRTHQGVNAGELAVFTANKAAKLVQSGVAVACDQYGNPLRGEAMPETKAQQEPVQAGGQAEVSSSTTVDVEGFTFDGVTDKKILDALAGAGLNSPDLVAMHIQDGKKLADIAGLDESAVAMLTEKYSGE